MLNTKSKTYKMHMKRKCHMKVADSFCINVWVCQMSIPYGVLWAEFLKMCVKLRTSFKYSHWGQDLSTISWHRDETRMNNMNTQSISTS